MGQQRRLLSILTPDEVTLVARHLRVAAPADLVERTIDELVAPLPERTLRRVLDAWRGGTEAPWSAQVEPLRRSGGTGPVALRLVGHAAGVARTEGRRASSSDAWPFQRDAVDALARAMCPTQPVLLHVATGGGKTRIANDLIARTTAGEGPVLWITKDWRLLRQAARDLAARHFPESALRRVGGGGTVLRNLSDDPSGARVVYTTLQTFRRRWGRGAGPFRPRLVIWDECHWGEHASSGRQLVRWCRRHEIPLVGLTATPRRPEESAFRVAYSKDFASLVSEGYLATPRLVAPIETGVTWTPARAHADADFRADSLARLGRHRGRNERIARHYAESRVTYGRTIMFACSVEHANRLAALLQAPPFGIPARVVHCHRPDAENRDSLDAFSRGEVDVLITVAMLTHGLDVPAVRSVFLCRPTLSDMLFSQMIGRASRRDEQSGKHEFHVVEFTDNLQKFGEQLVTARAYFRGTGSAAATGKPKRRSAPRRTPEHRFSLQGQPRWIPDTPDVPAPMRGLWYRQGQTFGIEVELTRDDWDGDMGREEWVRVAEPLRRALVEALGPQKVGRRVLTEYGSVEKSHDVWNVERDNSCGWEISSRVLADDDGFREVVRACDALSAVCGSLGLKVNFRTGLHLHIGWFGRQIAEIRRALQLARLFEPALATLVSPSRVADFDGVNYSLLRPNRYCRPISAVFRKADIARLTTLRGLRKLCSDHDDRYVTFNVRPLETIHTVEVRLHNGTIDPNKILLWLSLWQQILWAANGDRPIPDVPDRRVLVPDGDIVALVQEFLPRVGQQGFIARLERRRDEVVSLWRKHPELTPWAARSAMWRCPTPIRAAA